MLSQEVLRMLQVLKDAAQPLALPEIFEKMQANGWPIEVHLPESKFINMSKNGLVEIHKKIKKFPDSNRMYNAYEITDKGIMRLAKEGQDLTSSAPVASTKTSLAEGIAAAMDKRELQCKGSK